MRINNHRNSRELCIISSYDFTSMSGARRAECDNTSVPKVILVGFDVWKIAECYQELVPRQAYVVVLLVDLASSS